MGLEPDHRVALRNQILAMKEPVISPCGIFVAGKDNFEAMAHYDFTPSQAKAALFELYPLEEYGWSRATAIIAKAGISTMGKPMWRLEKG